MLIALVAVTLFAGVIIVVLVQDGRRRERAFVRALAQQADERRQLLDRIMHLSGKTWALPPVEEPPLDLPSAEEALLYPEAFLEEVE